MLGRLFVYCVGRFCNREIISDKKPRTFVELKSFRSCIIWGILWASREAI